MQYAKRIVIGTLLSAFTVSTFSPVRVATASSNSLKTPLTKADLIARGGVGKFILKAGKWVFVTAAGAVVNGAVSEAASGAVSGINDRNRLEQLAQRIHQEELNYYNQYGRPIPVNNQNVNILMSRVGASPSEQGYVINRMNLYWGY